MIVEKITYKFQTLTIAVLLDPGIYTASILINTSNAENYEQLLSNLNATSFPLEIDNVTEIQDITVTTGECYFWDGLLTKNIYITDTVYSIYV